MPAPLRKLAIALLLLVAVFGALCFLFPHRLAAFALDIERQRSGLHRAEIDIPGYHVVYLEGGSGEPLLLLHGIGADKDNWTRTARWLTTHYRVIAPDLPGFGESSKPDSASYGIDDQVKNIAALTDALHLDKFSIGGNSMGGWIAGAYTAEHPERVISLWLLDPGGVRNAKPSEMMTIIGKGGPVPIFARDPSEMRALINFVFVHPPYVPGIIIDEIAHQQASNYALNVKIFGELRDAYPTRALDTILAGSKTATLITWGDHDRVLDVSGAQALHDVMPNSAVDIMPDVGHVPPLEAPQATASDYLKFRASVWNLFPTAPNQSP